VFGNTSFPCEEGIFMSFDPRQTSVTAKPGLSPDPPNNSW
jgi:hypothetical protein